MPQLRARWIMYVPRSLFCTRRLSLRFLFRSTDISTEHSDTVWKGRCVITLSFRTLHFHTKLEIVLPLSLSVWVTFHFNYGHFTNLPGRLLPTSVHLKRCFAVRTERSSAFVISVNCALARLFRKLRSLSPLFSSSQTETRWSHQIE